MNSNATNLENTLMKSMLAAIEQQNNESYLEHLQDNETTLEVSKKNVLLDAFHKYELNFQENKKLLSKEKPKIRTLYHEGHEITQQLYEEIIKKSKDKKKFARNLQRTISEMKLWEAGLEFMLSQTDIFFSETLPALQTKLETTLTQTSTAITKSQADISEKLLTGKADAADFTMHITTVNKQLNLISKEMDTLTNVGTMTFETMYAYKMALKDIYHAKELKRVCQDLKQISQLMNEIAATAVSYHKAVNPEYQIFLKKTTQTSEIVEEIFIEPLTFTFNNELLKGAVQFTSSKGLNRFNDAFSSYIAELDRVRRSSAIATSKFALMLENNFDITPKFARKQLWV